MNEINAPTVSVIEPLTDAFEKTKEILFSPFDISKWFVIGFCAWLATLGQRGGNFNSGSGGNSGNPGSGSELKEMAMSHLPLIITIAAIVVILGIALSIVFAWLSSRGRFMFVHCIAHNIGEIKFPWQKYREQGNSLFLFRLAVGVIALVFFLLMAGVIFAAYLLLGKSDMGPVFMITAIVVTSILILPIGICLGIFLKFTEDFVTPIMFLRQCTCVRAWEEFWSLLRVNKAKFALFLLFQIALGFGVSAAIMAAVCVTCCVACCVMAIPFVGTVLMLPILVFVRSYSLCYLAQYGSDFDVFHFEEIPPQEELPLIEG